MIVGRLGAAGGLLLQEKRGEEVFLGGGGGGQGRGHARKNIIRRSCTNASQTTKKPECNLYYSTALHQMFH